MKNVQSGFTVKSLVREASMVGLTVTVTRDSEGAVYALWDNKTGRLIGDFASKLELSEAIMELLDGGNEAD